LPVFPTMKWIVSEMLRVRVGRYCESYVEVVAIEEVRWICPDSSSIHTVIERGNERKEKRMRFVSIIYQPTYRRKVRKKRSRRLCIAMLNFDEIEEGQERRQICIVKCVCAIMTCCGEKIVLPQINSKPILKSFSRWSPTSPTLVSSISIIGKSKKLIFRILNFLTPVIILSNLHFWALCQGNQNLTN
jgi:hypothetical protein